MYAALNQAGRLVYAQNIKAGQRDVWRCPICHQPMLLRVGQRKAAHFVHLNGRCKQHGKTPRQVMESLRHKQAKQVLAEALVRQGIKAQTEYYIAPTGQFADVYLPQTRQVIEYQKTPISAEQVMMRTKQYQQAGLTPIWLMDIQALGAPLRTSWKMTMWHYHPVIGGYWLALDVEQHALVLEYQVPLVYSRLAYYVRRQTLEVPQVLACHWQELISKSDARAIVVHGKERQAKPFDMLYAGILQQRHLSPIIRRLYQYGIQLEQLPQWYFTSYYQCLLSRTPGWVWLAWFTVFGRSIGQATFTAEEWEWTVRQLVIKQEIEVYQPPLMRQSAITLCAKAWLSLLCQKGIVIKLATQTYRYVADV